MPAPYVKKFALPSGESLTAVVLDEEEFFELVESLAGVFNIKSQERTDDDQIQRLKEARHIPMMSKGTKTAFVYDKYGIESNLASFVVRGHGPQLLRELIS